MPQSITKYSKNNNNHKDKEQDRKPREKSSIMLLNYYMDERIGYLSEDVF